MLDDVPFASITFLAAIVLIVVAYISDDVSFNNAFKDLLYAGGGSFGIGYVRNQARRGVKR